MPPRVTVLIPVHTGRSLLPATLSTVLAQTLTDLEVIVCGDGCTDGSEEVVHACSDPRVRWLGFPKSPGFGYANRGRALAEATGSCIAYIAPDDAWSRSHLMMLTRALD